MVTLIGRHMPSPADSLVVRQSSIDDGGDWLEECLRIGDLQSALLTRLIGEGRQSIARSAGVNALAAFRAALHLLATGDPRRDSVMSRLRTCADTLLRHGEPLAEFVTLPGIDRAVLHACFLPASRLSARAPVVICIGDEDEPLELMLSRVAPAMIAKGMALLLVEMSEVADASGLQHAGLITAEMRVGDCIDYLASRRDVDAERIAVWGDGLAAAIATRAAVAEARVRAAVCDGGLWDALRVGAGVAWLSGGDEVVARPGDTVRRVRLAQRIRCPFLVVASERNVASVQEAVALQADCVRLGIAMDLEVPGVNAAPRDIVDAMMRSEARVADWLSMRLGGMASDRAQTDTQQVLAGQS